MTNIDRVLEHLQQLNVNFVAIDFDQTLIDFHTRGFWRGSPAELALHVRPIFAEFILSALSTNSIHVAIVTFSRQPDMIKLVLQMALGDDMASRIVVRGMDKSGTYVVRGMDKSRKYEGKGKQAHMASAVEELLQQANEGPGMEITKETTLLIDDLPKNIKYAKEDGVRAILFTPDQPQDLYQKLISLK